MKLPSLNSLLLALAATATFLPISARADRWDDRDRDDHEEWHHRRPRVVVVERDRPTPQIPYATASDHRGFVISPYTGQLLDARGVKSGTVCYDFTAKGAPYIRP